MKLTRFACVAVTGAMLALPGSLFAHGGQYRGPGDTVPPNPGGGGGRTGGPSRPTTPGPGGPTTPTPGTPATPGPQTPTSPTGSGPRSTPTTGGPRGVQIGDDLTQWQFWWEFNKDPYLDLKSKVFGGTITTGSDDFVMGRGLKSEADNTLRPSEKDLKSTVVPALKKALEDKDSNKDIVSSCMVALAKIGRDQSILPLFKKYLPDNDQEKRETAAIAMGIAALPEAVPDLLELAKDTKAARKLVKRTSVDFRQRSFAVYGLGLIGYASKDNTLKRKLFETMKGIIDDDKNTRRDIQVAALNVIRLLNIDASTEDGKRLKTDAVDYLLAYIDRKGIFEQIQSHGYTALAELLGRTGDTKGTVKARILKTVKKKRGPRQWTYQSAILALGQMATPEDTECSKAIQTYMDKGKDHQAKYFCSIALGKIGGEKNKDFLRKRLMRSKTKSIEQPWLALGLAIMDYDARQKDASRDIDSTAMDIKRIFDKTKNPIFAAGLGISLGIMGDKDSGDDILERMLDVKNDSEPAGYLAASLGLMGFKEAKEDINALVEKATRRPKLLTQCSIALGLLGDKEIGLKLIKRMEEKNTVAVFSALAQALGFIGDRRSLPGLVSLLDNKQLQPLSRAFAAVALGLIGDKEPLPWNSKIGVNINYRANVETLTGNSTGILDIL